MSNYNFNNPSSCGMNSGLYGESSVNYGNGILQLPDNLSYGMITPHYSPDTTVAITLRHFEKEAKSQAEREYDDENGSLPPPPPEDDPTIDPDTRKAHKKKRKVRSAIVSRRKTAIYLEKLETELETRDSMNTTLAKNLELYREVIADVKAKIDAMQHSLNKHSSSNHHNNNKRMRPSYNHFQTSNNSGRIIKQQRRSHQQIQQRFYQNQQQQQQQQSNYLQQQPLNNFHQSRHSYQHQQQNYNFTPETKSTSFIPTDPLTPPPSSNIQKYNQELYMNQNNSSNSDTDTQSNTPTELYSTISAEEIGDTSLPSYQRQQQPEQAQQLKQYQYQSFNYKQTSEADFSECSDTVEWPQNKPVQILENPSFEIPLTF